MKTEFQNPNVADDRIVDFDFFAVKPIDGDLHRGWKKIHEWPDIFYTPRNGGHWVFSRAEDINAAWLDAELFSNRGVAMTHEEREMRLFPGEADAPLHTAYRSLLQPFFSQKAAHKFEAEMRGITCDLIDGFIADGRCEFQSQVSRRMPIYVFLNFMQLPREHAELLLPAADWLSRDPDPASFERAMGAMMGYLEERITERMSAGGQDFISHLLSGQVADRPITRQEVLSLSANVMFGGLDTVVSSMGFFFNFLAGSAAHRTQLAEDPSLIPEAVEELFRRFSIANFGRMVTRDFEFRGLPLRCGDLVLLPAALHNLDERKYADPMKVDFHRPAKHHMGFGTGIHRCLGAQLARLELRVLLQEWFKRIPDFQIQVGAEVRVKSGRINTVNELPLQWAH